METKKRKRQDIEWVTIHERLKPFKDYAVECCLAGMAAYLDKECTSQIIGEAISASFKSSDEVMERIAGILDGRVVDEKEVEGVVREQFFLYGVFKAFVIRATGKVEHGEVTSAKE